MVEIVDLYGIVINRIFFIIAINRLLQITKILRKRKSCFVVSQVGLIFAISVIYWLQQIYEKGIVLLLLPTIEILLFSIYLLLFANERDIKKTIMISMTAELIRRLVQVLSAFLAFLFTNHIFHEMRNFSATLLLYALETFFFFCLIKGINIRDFDKIFNQKSMQYAIIAIGVTEISASSLVSFWYKKEVSKYFYASVVILLMALSWAILWTINKYLSEREKEKLIADNQQLAARLHKTKEFYPALRQALEKIREQGDSKDLERLTRELEQFTGQQIQESKYEDMREKQFAPTGILMLDELVQAYGQEAAEKGITFDMYAGSAMDSVLESQKISPLDFLRLVGDLTRNAFRAVEKSKRRDGAILLTMGCVDGEAELAVYDNGAPFPLEVLNRIGERGNTQGGTGHGLADTMDYVEQYHCTFKLAEYDSEEEFTKGISITWDGKNARLIESDRSSKLADTCIFKTE